MSINVIVTFEATPEKASELANLLNQAKRTLPEVEGCKGVSLFNSRKNPCMFTLVEEWESDRQHQAHIANVVSSGAWAHIASHLAADPVSDYHLEL